MRGGISPIGDPTSGDPTLGEVRSAACGSPSAAVCVAISCSSSAIRTRTSILQHHKSGYHNVTTVLRRMNKSCSIHSLPLHTARGGQRMTHRQAITRMLQFWAWSPRDADAAALEAGRECKSLGPPHECGGVNGVRRMRARAVGDWGSPQVKILVAGYQCLQHRLVCLSNSSEHSKRSCVLQYYCV